MKTFHSLMLAVLVLGTSACASHAAKQSSTASLSGAPSITGTSVATPDETLAPEIASREPLAPKIWTPDGTAHEVPDERQSPDAQLATEKDEPAPPLDAAIATANHSPADADLLANAEEETEALDATKIRDPWERYNRKMYKFNLKMDKYIAHPIGVAYDKVVPDVVQRRVTSFFANLKEPRNMINQLLQGRPLGAARTLGRFVVNTTAGVGGIFDPARKLELNRADEDFGQTLAVWGWDNSKFFVLPLKGPATVRDFFGGLGDKPLNPTGYIEDGGVSIGVTLVNLGSKRSGAFAFDKMRTEAFDEYAFVRDAWAQRRRHQIEDRR